MSTATNPLLGAIRFYLNSLETAPSALTVFTTRDHGDSALIETALAYYPDAVPTRLLREAHEALRDAATARLNELT